MINNNNDNELQFIKGVGPKRAAALIESGLYSKTDIVRYFPRAYIDRRSVSSISALADDIRNKEYVKDNNEFFSSVLKSEVTIIAKIYDANVKTFGRNKKAFIIILADSSPSKAKILFWNKADYFAKVYKAGQIVVVSGKPELDDRGFINFNHPDIEIIDEEDIELYSQGKILPKYKITEQMKKAGVSMNVMRKIVQNILYPALDSINETLPASIIKQKNLPEIKTVVSNLHFPEDSLLLEKCRYRVKFEELFYYQLAIKLKKKIIEVSETAPAMSEKSKSSRVLYEQLPFELTKDQKKVLREVAEDIAQSKPMNRLLQGDVGSGKTIVAIFAMLMAIDNGYQVAFMAPTEILAEQHFHTIKKFIEPLGFKTIQLVGGLKKKLKTQYLISISEGKANIVVGTHAMFQSDIVYNKLGLVIIDELHRFGVSQKADLIQLAKKSFSDFPYSPHILNMTATPIPRTLTMTVYGDLDVSVIKEMPKNRKPIKTKVGFDENRQEIYNFIKEEIKSGRQIYIVFPLVEKSDKLELKAATEHFEEISSEIFPEFKCGLIHGQMFWYEKEEAMTAFLNKEYDILVATTVIEVGIDVPNASVMLIEDAERFGLSQLHQLRGRVGRGADQSYCILMTKSHYKYLLRRNDDIQNEKVAAIIRLKTMEETTDGFQVSEVDLKLRGPGDILGTKQAGLPDFKYADIINDTEIIMDAKNFAQKILSEDPQLRNTEHALLKKNIQKLYGNENSFIQIA